MMSPIPQATAELSHPLTSLVNVWKTYSVELFCAMTADGKIQSQHMPHVHFVESSIPNNVMTPARKNPTWHIAPTVSSMLINLGSQRLPMKGMAVAAHMISVVCHRWETYPWLLKEAKPTTMFAINAGLEAQLQTQAKTVIHPCIKPKKRFHLGAKVADHLY